MKTKLLLIACASAAWPAAGALEKTEAIPSAFPPERYEALIAKSPFALATPVAAPPPPQDKGFAEGWYVSGLAQLDGKDFVTIKARDLSTQFQLFGDTPSNGVKLQKVEWSSAIGRSTVTIEKDGQAAKLEFNQAELQAPGGAAPAPGAPNHGGMRPPMPGNAGMTAPRPGIPRPAQPVVQPQQLGGLSHPGIIQKQAPGVVSGLPAVNPQIPRPGGVLAPAPTADPRRRIRVINNVPAQPTQ